VLKDQGTAMAGKAAAEAWCWEGAAEAEGSCCVRAKAGQSSASCASDLKTWPPEASHCLL